MPRFVMVSVNTGVLWPANEQTVDFEGRQIRLVPPVRDEAGHLRAYPMTVIEYAKGQPEHELVSVIRRFLNALSWREQTYIREVDVTYGAPLRAGTRIPDNFTTPTFDTGELPAPADDRAQIALAFYREGLDLEHVHRAYSFLSLAWGPEVGPG